MSTLSFSQGAHDAVAALGKAQNHHVQSDKALVDRVGGGAGKALAPIAELAGAGTVQIAPRALLHELGKATTPLLPRDLFEDSARWAIVHYLFAFEPPAVGEPLRLTQGAKGLVLHHRTLFGENIGVGFALTLARHVLERRHPAGSVRFVDADDAINQGGIYTPLGKKPVSAKSLRPDYFAVVTSATNPLWMAIYVIEAKGTHSGSHHLVQLRKARLQVQSVTMSGWPPPSLIYATHLGRSPIRTFAVDPEEDHWSGEYEITRERQDDEPPLHGDAGRFRVTNPVRFRSELSDLADARLMEFAGASAEADELVPRRIRQERPRPTREVQMIDGQAQPIVGVSTLLPLQRGVAIEVTTGLVVSAYEAIRRHDPVRIRFASESATQNPEGTPSTNQGTSSIAGDGSFFRVRVVG